MTVRELMMELAKYDCDLEVMVTWEGTLHRVTPADLTVDTVRFGMDHAPLRRALIIDGEGG